MARILLRDQPPGHVGRTAGRERHDQRHRPRRPSLRVRAGSRDRKRHNGDKQPDHVSSTDFSLRVSKTGAATKTSAKAYASDGDAATHSVSSPMPATLRPETSRVRCRTPQHRSDARRPGSASSMKAARRGAQVPLRPARVRSRHAAVHRRDLVRAAQRRGRDAGRRCSACHPGGFRRAPADQPPPPARPAAPDHMGRHRGDRVVPRAAGRRGRGLPAHPAHLAAAAQLSAADAAAPRLSAISAPTRRSSSRSRISRCSCS